jgi:hypothetical protein
VEGKREAQPPQPPVQADQPQRMVPMPMGEDDAVPIPWIQFQAVQIMDQSVRAPTGTRLDCGVQTCRRFCQDPIGTNGRTLTPRGNEEGAARPRTE